MSRNLIEPRAAFSAIAACTLATAPAWATADCRDWMRMEFHYMADTEDLNRCLDEGRSPRQRDSSGLTPLHLAAR